MGWRAGAAGRNEVTSTTGTLMLAIGCPAHVPFQARTLELWVVLDMESLVSGDKLLTGDDPQGRVAHDELVDLIPELRRHALQTCERWWRRLGRRIYRLPVPPDESKDHEYGKSGEDPLAGKHVFARSSVD